MEIGDGNRRLQDEERVKNTRRALQRIVGSYGRKGAGKDHGGKGEGKDGKDREGDGARGGHPRIKVDFESHLTRIFPFVKPLPVRVSYHIIYPGPRLGFQLSEQPRQSDGEDV